MKTRLSSKASAYTQRGVTTLAISLILLAILSVVVLFSTNVAFFEQRTTTNETRSQLAEQAAEFQLNLAGEYLKSKRTSLISDQANGWLGGTDNHWALCSSATMTATHPCMAERDLTRRAQLYFYTADGTLTGSPNLWTAASAIVPTNLDTSTVGVGGAHYATTTTVNALLCRLDTSLATPACRADPVAGNRVAIALVSTVAIAGENASATVKETWGTITKSTPVAAVPLIASGTVSGLGNSTIVTAPNGGGYGVPVSIWSPVDVCMGGSKAQAIAGTFSGCTGIGSPLTCQRDAFLQSTPESGLKTTCVTTASACGCPNDSDDYDYLSGHSGAKKIEGVDILDRDSNTGESPDINFYPGRGLDDVNDLTDDSTFEYVFNVAYESDSTRSPISGTGNTLQNCSGPTNCAVYALTEDLGAESITCSDLNALGTNATGLYYVSDSSAASECGLSGTIGQPDTPAIIVVNDKASLTSLKLYGMLFVRSDNKTATLRGTGTTTIVGSAVVEGDVSMAGQFTIIYDDTAAATSTKKIPGSAKFGRIPGSWLDSTTGF